MRGFLNLRFGVAGMVIGGAIVLFASPALANGVVASGSPVCAADGTSWTVTWAVHGSNNQGNDIVSVAASDALGAVALSPGTPAPWDTNFSGSSSYGSDVASATLHVAMTFANGEHRNAAATVARPDTCLPPPAPEETTTSAEETTTTAASSTTEAAPTTDAAPTTEAVPTTEAATPTTAAATPTTASAVSPIEATPTTPAAAVLGEQATTTTASPTTAAATTVGGAANAPSLPFTGPSDIGGRTLLGVLLLLTGVALAATGRRVGAYTN